MRKVFCVIVIVGMVLAGCASYTVWYRQDGLVPINHFQTAKNVGERLVFISPVLAQNHRQSLLYIITNPEDIISALDTLGDPGVIRPKDLDSTIKVFSPVIIMSSRDIPTFDNVFYRDISNQDGIAVFSLPSFVDQFFYAYVIVRNDYKWNSNDPIEIWTGIMPLPPDTQDVYIAFKEEYGDMVVSANTHPIEVQNAYDKTTGFYGQLLGKKDQVGFIKIGYKERVTISKEQSKAKALADGATYSVYSRYYTYHQETRTSKRFVPEQSHWESGQTTGFYDNRGVKIGEARTEGKRVVDAASHMENENYTVNVRVLQELEFELYKGNVFVLRGRTPVDITGIEVGSEYTLRWVSPVNGKQTLTFKMGLNFLGYPANGRCYIK